MAKTGSTGIAGAGLGSATLALAATVLAGCAATRLDAQWVDPQLAAGALRGARVLVACEAQDTTLKRVCQDQLAAEVVARGATPVLLADDAPPAGPATDERYAQEARRAGARATLAQAIAPYGSHVSPGFSIGFGGFGFGHGGVGAGVGISAPIGGGQLTTGYAASTRVIDAASARVLWSARASSPPSQDVNGQLRELARAVFESADKSGVF